MDPILAIIWSRTAERLLVIIAGIAAIWIGYRLFALMPSRRDGESKIELPGGVSILLSRVGPGTLFALFGAGLIAYSAASPVKYERSENMQTAADGSQKTEKLQSMSNSQQIKAAPKPPRPAASLAPEAAISMINTWLAETTVGADARTSGLRTMAAREAKLAILRETWSTAVYGPYDSFHIWAVENAANGAPPAANAKAAELFLGAGQ